MRLVFMPKIIDGWIYCKPGIEGANHPPINRITNNRDIKIMCAYSAKKKLANVMAEYSTLNPETSSDSPSVKSKGARLVSANAETRNIIAAGNSGATNQISSCASTILVILISPTSSNTEIIIKPIETS